MGSGFSACGSVSVSQSLRSLNGPDHQPSKSQRKGRAGGTVNPFVVTGTRGSNLPQSGSDISILSLKSVEDGSTSWAKTSTVDGLAGGLSDSCDSGIYDGNKRSQILSTKTSRDRIISSKQKGDNEHLGSRNKDGTSSRLDRSSDVIDTRFNRPISKPGSIRPNPKSVPNLQELAIHEVDEDEEAFALRMNRPVRPKSAHVRRKRSETTKSMSTPSKKRTKNNKRSDGESSEFTDDEDFDSDLLSIPDETDIQLGSRGSSHTTVKLGPKFERVGSEGQGDWWTGLTPLEDEVVTARSTGSFLSRVEDNNFAKKASLSSVILLSSIESTDPAVPPVSTAALTPLSHFSPTYPTCSASPLSQPHSSNQSCTDSEFLTPNKNVFTNSSTSSPLTSSNQAPHPPPPSTNNSIVTNTECSGSVTLNLSPSCQKALTQVRFSHISNIYLSVVCCVTKRTFEI